MEKMQNATGKPRTGNREPKMKSTLHFRFLVFGFPVSSVFKVPGWSLISDGRILTPEEPTHEQPVNRRNFRRLGRLDGPQAHPRSLPLAPQETASAADAHCRPRPP